MDKRETHMRTWLAHVFKDTSLEVTPASRDASFRRYFRVTQDSDSYIVMDAPPEFEDSKPFVNVCNLLREAGVSVPEILYADLEQGFLLLSDFGRRHYLGALAHEDTERLYTDALNALLAIQRRATVLGKPSPDFFRLALDDLGATADTAVMVGDDIDADIGGAQAAGLKAVQVRTGKFTDTDLAHSLVRPDARIDSIANLPDLLEEFG